MHDSASRAAPAKISRGWSRMRTWRAESCVGEVVISLIGIYASNKKKILNKIGTNINISKEKK